MQPPHLPPLNFDDLNEAEVGGEVIEPLLRALGYGAHTDHPILRQREVEIRYKYSQLGRKKAGRDPALRGRFDYLCEVRTFGSWLLEAKSPCEAISIADIEQAHSYAVHPEIRACMFAISNGREFLLFETNMGAAAEPVIRLSYEQLATKRFFALYNLVSPDAIKKRRVADTVNLARPLAPGFGPEARIVGGYSCYETIDLHIEKWPAGLPRPNTEVADALKEIKFPIAGDRCYRTDAGEIVARIRFARLHETHDVLARTLGIEVQEYICRDEAVSFDAARPNVFQTQFKSLLPAGATTFDIAQRKSFMTLVPMPIGMYAEVIGYVSGNKFIGIYAGRALQGFVSPVGQVEIWTYLRGHCEIQFEAV